MSVNSETFFRSFANFDFFLTFFTHIHQFSVDRSKSVSLNVNSRLSPLLSSPPTAKRISYPMSHAAAFAARDALAPVAPPRRRAPVRRAARVAPYLDFSSEFASLSRAVAVSSFLLPSRLESRVRPLRSSRCASPRAVFPSLPSPEPFPSTTSREADILRGKTSTLAESQWSCRKCG